MEAGNTSRRNLSKFCQRSWSRRLARHCPFGVSQAFVSCLGSLYYWRQAEERQLICRTVDQVCGQTGDQDRRVRHRNIFRGIFQHYQEKLFVAYAPEAKVKAFLSRRLALQGQEELEAALGAGRGVLMVTGHFGAVEFLPAALSLRGYPVAVIVRPQTPELAASMTKRAALVNLHLIIPENGKVMPAALRALREGRILITEMDEFEMWRGQGADDRVNFLGFAIPGDRTLDVLQKRAQAPVLTALVHRQPRRRYTVALEPVAGSAAAGRLSSLCLQRLEAAIRSQPEQWYQWKEFGKLLAGGAPPQAPAVGPSFMPTPEALGRYAHA